MLENHFNTSIIQNLDTNMSVFFILSVFTTEQKSPGNENGNACQKFTGKHTSSHIPFPPLIGLTRIGHGKSGTKNIDIKGLGPKNRHRNYGTGKYGIKKSGAQKYGTEKIWDERIPRCLPPLRFLLLPIFGRVLCERDASWWNTIQKGRKK